MDFCDFFSSFISLLWMVNVYRDEHFHVSYNIETEWMFFFCRVQIISKIRKYAWNQLEYDISWELLLANRTKMRIAWFRRAKKLLSISLTMAQTIERVLVSTFTCSLYFIWVRSDFSWFFSLWNALSSCCVINFCIDTEKRCHDFHRVFSYFASKWQESSWIWIKHNLYFQGFFFFFSCTLLRDSSATFCNMRECFE